MNELLVDIPYSFSIRDKIGFIPPGSESIFSTSSSGNLISHCRRGEDIFSVKVKRKKIIRTTWNKYASFDLLKGVILQMLLSSVIGSNHLFFHISWV